MLELREIERNDMKIINSWRNNQNVISYLGDPFRFINQDVDEKWFDNYMLNRNNCVRCAIENDQKIVGLVSLTNIDNLNRSAEFHIMIGDVNYHNKGIGTFAVNEILKHAFYNLNLHRVMLTVLENNKRAQHVYEKLGFVKEGCLIQVYFKNGKYENAFLYSILSDEYKNCMNSGGVIKCLKSQCYLRLCA